MRKLFVSGIIFISFHFVSLGQLPTVSPAAFNAGGGTIQISPEFTVDWSVGESSVTETFYGENPYSNSVVSVKWGATFGVLQPFDATHIVYNYLIPHFTNEEIRIFPVPSHNNVFIDFRSVVTGKMSMQLVSMDGKVLGLKEFYQAGGNGTQKWDLSNKVSGAYYFRIQLTSDTGSILKEGLYKIEKIK